MFCFANDTTSLRIAGQIVDMRCCLKWIFCRDMENNQSAKQAEGSRDIEISITTPKLPEITKHNLIIDLAKKSYGHHLII